MADSAPPYARAVDLPLFENPPVREVSIGIQYQSLPIRAVDLGLLRDRFQDRYPEVDERTPVVLQIENLTRRHGPDVQLQFAIADRMPIPMLVLTSADGSSVVQFQADRMACGWRRTGTIGYPRYEDLRDEVLRNLTIFADFVENVRDGEDIKVTQAEVGYVNSIPMPEGGRPDVLANAVPVHLPLLNDRAGQLTVSALNAGYSLTFENVDHVDYARLHVRGDPDLTATDPTLRMTLIYRGEPYERSGATPSLEGLMAFFDEGHEQIVRAFAANTTAEAQRSWRRST
jgi:uncharacterized protein (TIGR04255 family)